jgi:hypothetical protein
LGGSLGVGLHLGLPGHEALLVLLLGLSDKGTGTSGCSGLGTSHNLGLGPKLGIRALLSRHCREGGRLD